MPHESKSHQKKPMKSKRMLKKTKKPEESTGKKILNSVWRCMKSKKKMNLRREKECQHLKRCILYERVSEPSKIHSSHFESNFCEVGFVLDRKEEKQM